MEHALYALNTVLVLARHMAAAGEKGADVADVLDIAEYLLRLIAVVEDRTVEFREQLAGLRDKYKQFALAVDRFDGTIPPRW
jgi:hypothetical protein